MEGPNDDEKELAGEILKLRQRIAAYEVHESVSRVRTSRIEELSSLKEDLLRSGTLQEKLKRITDGLVNVFDADFTRIWITKRGDQCGSGCVHAKVTKGPHVCRYRDRCLHLLASSGRYTYIDGEVHGRVPFGCYKIGRVAAGLEPKFLTNDVAHDTRIHDQDWARTLGLISFAGFRLLSEKRTPIGVLALFSKHELSQDDAVMLGDLANTTSQVIQTAMAEESMRESEERFRSAFEQTAVGICHVSPEGRFLRVNQKLCAILGYTSDELLCLTFQAITHPDDLESDLEYVRQVLADEINTYSMEKRYFRKDASQVWANLTVSLTRDASGAPQYFISVVEDISSRKIAGNRLTQSEAKFRSIVENSLVGMFTVDEAYHFIYANDELCRILGYSRENLLGLDFREVLTDDSRALGGDRYIRRQRGESVPSRYEIDVVRGDGTIRHVEMLVSVVRDASALPRTMGQLIDVSERKRAEQALLESEQRLRLAWETSPDYFSISRLKDAMIVDLNRGFTELTGYARDESIGRSALDLNLWLDISDRIKLVSALTRDRQVRDFETKFRRKDGEVITVSISAGLMKLDGEPHLLAIVKDIEDSKKAQEALGRSEFLYRNVIENIEDVFYRSDKEGRLLMGSPSGARLFGYDSVEEMIGLPLDSFWVDPQARQSLIAQIKELGRVKDFEGLLKRKDGSTFVASFTTHFYRDESGTIQGTQGIIRDVTERRQLQRQLLLAQKMEAIGTLAGGIAHDFNNLLQAILGYTDLLLMRREASDPDRQKLEIVHQAAKDGADLVSRILAFSMKAEFRARPTDLNQEIRRIEKLLRRTVPRMIKIDLVLANDLWVIDADPAQIEQVLLNLAVNAQHAMPDGGRLLIETSKVRLKHDYVRKHLQAKAGKHVLLTVSDTGIGMKPEVVDRIFEPFFTTKADGEGTGLGLAMVHGIVSQHGGYIRCYSEPGLGTSFKIYFPVSLTESLLDMAVTREMPAFGTETILLVDDDDRIRDVAQEMIETGGYKVLAAPSGEEALKMYVARRGEISLVILDLIMPGMGGKRCLQELLRIDPDSRVLIASGYSSKGLTIDETGTGARGFIRKPYDAKDILTYIRKVLDRGHL